MGLHQLFPCVYSASCGLSFCTARASCPPLLQTRSCQRFVSVLSACSLAASVVFAGSSVLPYHYCTLLLRPPCKIQCWPNPWPEVPDDAVLCQGCYEFAYRQRHESHPERPPHVNA